MPREFSEDLCWRIIYLHTEGLPTTEIANTLHMSKGTVNKIKKRYNSWGCVKNPFKGVHGQRKLFSREDLTILRNLVRKRVDWYLDELIYEMECLRGKRYTIVPALTMEGFVAIDIFEGSCDKKKFVDFVLGQVVSNTYELFISSLFATKVSTVIDKIWFYF